MAIKTRFTELFCVEHPVVGGALMHLSRARLVAAVSEAGGLGVLASAIFRDKDSLRNEIRHIKSLTSKPFAVNLNLFPMMRPVDNREYLDVIVSEGVKVVETSGHELPEEMAAEIKRAGLLWIHKCAAVRHAKRAERLGADAVTVVGYENGGATGKFDVTTMVLVPATCEAVRIPVIGGGGVVDGRGLAAVLCLGADAAIIGSRLVLTEECEIHPNTRRALLEADIYSTTLVMRSVGMTHRVLLNEAARKVLEIEATGGKIEDLLPYVVGEKTQKVYFDGEVDAGMNYISQAVGLIHEIRPAGEVVRSMVEEAEKIFSRFSRLATSRIERSLDDKEKSISD